MVKRGGLGRGLEALIPRTEETSTAASVLQIPTGEIKPNPRQPREQIKPDSLEELANSIRLHGILQPLLVTKDALSGEYILIAGERRLQAARLAQLETVPAILSEASGDQARLELALIENLQRANLTPLEEAEAYHHLSQDFNLTQEEVAARVGKSRPAVANTLRLLQLAPAARKALAGELITEGHARALLGLSHPAAQEAALQTVINHELNVRQTEELVKRLSGERRQHLPRTGKTPEIEELEERLRARLGTRVTLRAGRRGGTVVIHYYSNEELDTILEQILKE